MLTLMKVQEMMVGSLRSPHDLADRLGLVPSQTQRKVLDRFTSNEHPLLLTNDPVDHTVRAVGLCALWRLLLVPGSNCQVISSSKSLAAEFFGFLYELTTKIDPALTACCSWPRWDVLRVGSDAGYELRLISNKPEWVRKAPEGATTLVILGAASSRPSFCEVREVFEQHAGAEDIRLISLW